MKDFTLLSTADWDNPFWTNKQHVAISLARSGHRVLYIDSLGLRRPARSDTVRIVRRLFKGLMPPKKTASNLWVWSPIVLPYHGSRVVRHFNRLWLRSGLYLWLRYLKLGRDCLWTYNPLTEEYFDPSSFDYLVYHCVDDIKTQPGMDSDLIETAEARLTSRADIVFVTSPHLAVTRSQWNPNTHYLGNVADFEHFSQALKPETVVPKDLAEIPGPRLGFIGAITDYKLDYQLIREIAVKRPEWSLVFIGKVGEGDPWTEIKHLQGLPNLNLLGPRPYDQLPAYLKGIDVALLPNAINQYTDAMFPMKFFEYLAAGRPVVSVDLKSIQDYTDMFTVARSPEEFIDGIESILKGDVPSLEDRQALAKEHTYESRTRKMLALMDQE